MFCQKCGKEISDQARFCNYCGNPVSGVPPQTPPQPQIQNVAPAAPQAAAKPAPAKKTGKIIWSIILVVAVFFGAKWMIQSSNAKKVIQSAVNSCNNGGLYQDGFLRYGMTRLSVPGYSLVEIEGDQYDYLRSPDEECLLFVWNEWSFDDAVSYDLSTEKAILDSFWLAEGEVEMIDFRKYEVNGFPVIRYIVERTVEGERQYQGELVVFPSKRAKRIMRLNMVTWLDGDEARERIDTVFDTLEVSTSFAVTDEEIDRIVWSESEITVK